MKRLKSRFGLFLAMVLGLGCAGAALGAGPILSIRLTAPGSVELRWDDPAGGLRLEEATGLEPPIAWAPVAIYPLIEGTGRRMLLGVEDKSRFLRLAGSRAAPGVTLVAETSPSSGETGVAVTRETIVRLSRPLVITTTAEGGWFFAEAAGRKILSRVEVGRDRLSATLFYLEPLPGNTRVRVTIDGDSIFDEEGVAVDADGDGAPGGTYRFEFETVSWMTAAGTAITGRVLASEREIGPGGAPADKPLAGVTISVDGAEETQRAVTDEFGNFRLEPCPAGRFFVHVDGRTAWESQWPGGAYYPMVGKAWEAVAGVATNLAGGTGVIYLPRVEAGTLQAVSATAPTTIGFPEEVVRANPILEGVAITVPANALFNDGGARGGRVGIAPVAPDRLPEPLPFGLEFPLVITIQTDGASNFDQPVAVRFPNLPDPRTGVKLSPGAKTALWSFNHDTGRWEIQGPMTVTADGNFVECDPGVGVRQPGWHGTNPGTSGDGGPPRPPLPPPADDDCEDTIELLAKEAFLRAVAAGMRGISGTGNYAGDALAHFLDGTGEPRHYGPGSGPSEDLRNSQGFQEQLRAIERELQREVGGAIQRNPGFPTTPGFRPSVDGINFYGENGSNHQLAYTFGNTSASDMNAQVLDVLITPRGDGGYDYAATLKFEVKEKYQFNANDNSTIDGLPHDLQKCGQATPFDVSIGLEMQIRGSFGPARRLARTANVPVVQGGGEEGGRRLALDLDSDGTASFVFGDEMLIAHQDGGTVRVQAAGLLGGRFHYAIEDARTGELLERGRKEGVGNLFQNLILPPERKVRARVMHAESLMMGKAEWTTPGSGFRFTVPPIGFGAARGALDSDRDGLTDEMEFIAGTFADRVDSDGDGISDLMELSLGQDPLGGLAAGTGIIGGVDTPGAALDVAAFNQLLAVADGPAGVSIFDVFDRARPVLAAQLPMPGRAKRVAWADAQLLAVDEAGGVGVADVSDSRNARWARFFNLGGEASAVAAAGRFAFAGMRDGRVVSTEIDTGVSLASSQLSWPVIDLAVAGDFLYALTEGALHVLERQRGIPSELGRIELNEQGPQRLFVGGGQAYAVFKRGYALFDVSPGTTPRLMLRADMREFGWRQLVSNGSGYGMVVAGPNSTPDGSQHARLYDLRRADQAGVFLAEFQAPARSQSVTIHEGMAYAAADTGGLQVINYLPFDRNGIPPQARLTSSAAGGRALSGDLLRLTAEASDDVQVRNVRFYLNGLELANDGNFPFEYSLTLSGPEAGGSELRFRARATDTGGNEAWSEELLVTVGAAAATEGRFKFLPEPDAIRSGVQAVGVLLDAAAAAPPGGWKAEELTLTWAGLDEEFGTTDDAAMRFGELKYVPSARALLLIFPVELREGLYKAAFAGSTRDATGKNFPAASWEFRAKQATQFRVVGYSPANSIERPLGSVSVTFSAPIGAGMNAPGQLRLSSFGEDQRFDTEDDQEVTGGTLAVSGGGRTLTWTFSSPIGYASYRAVVSKNFSDVAGSALGTEFRWFFSVADQTRPSVREIRPETGTVFSTGPSVVEVFFDDSMEASSLNSDTIWLQGSGPDERLATEDDVRIVGPVVYTPSIRRAVMQLNGSLGPGSYRVAVSTNATDEARNPLMPFDGGIFSVGKAIRVQGVAEYEGGEKAGGARVGLSHGIESVTSKPDGSFLSDWIRFPAGTTLRADASGLRAGRWFEAEGVEVFPKHNSVVDLGRFVLREACPTRLDAGEFLGRPLEGEVTDLKALEIDGETAVYGVTGSFFGSKRARVWRWDGFGWNQVGGDFTYSSGMPAHLRTVTVYDDGGGPAIYTGGEFDRAGETEARNVARWRAGRWESVGGGLGSAAVRGAVNTLLPFDSGGGRVLLAGGTFAEALGSPNLGVARWDGRVWAAFSGGLSNSTFKPVIVNALALWEEEGKPVVYAGGQLLEVSGVPAGNLARWREGAWSAVPGGVTSGGDPLFARVHALAVFDDGQGKGAELFVGGAFDRAGGLPAKSIARWTGTGWAQAGEGFGAINQGRGGVGHVARLIAGRHPSPYLMACGSFRVAYGVEDFFGSGGLARWTGTEWEQIRDGAGALEGVNGSVAAAVEFDDGEGTRLFVGGGFEHVFSGRELYSLPYVARRTWERWEPAGQVLDRPVRTMLETAAGGKRALYGGGNFRFGGAARLNGLFRWDGRTYHPVGGGVRFRDGRTPGEVSALATATFRGETALYVGGNFEVAGDAPAANIARWDGASWSAVGGAESNRFSAPGLILALRERKEGEASWLVAGGFFAEIGGVLARNAARFDGTKWSPMGEGPGGSVFAFAEFPHEGRMDLFAGGDVRTFHGQSKVARGVARWDGTGWRPVLGAGTVSPEGLVLSLATHDDGGGLALYAAGRFDRSVGEGVLNGVAKWDGLRWRYLTEVKGGGEFGGVNALVVYDDGRGPALYAAVELVSREFEGSGFALARWDGAAWEIFPESRVGEILALVVPDREKGELLLGGGDLNGFQGGVWKWGKSAAPCLPVP